MGLLEEWGRAAGNWDTGSAPFVLPADEGGSGTLIRPLYGVGRRLEVWPESHWPGFALRQSDVFQSYTA